MAQQGDRVYRRLDAGDPRTLGGFRLLAAEDDGVVSDGIRCYLARSPHDARTVTVTAVRPDRAGDATLRERMRREAETARAAAGPWVVPLVDADPDAAVPWLAYAYVPTLPLTGLVREQGPFAEPSVRALGSALAQALGTLHDAGRTHGGLGPHAVSLAADGPRLGALGDVRAADGGDAAAEVRALAEVLVYAATGRTGAGAAERAGALAEMPTGLADALGPALGAGKVAGKGGARNAPRLAKLHAALDTPVRGRRPELTLPARSVAALAARAAEALALEAPDGPDAVPPGADHATRQLRTGGADRHAEGGTLQLRAAQEESGAAPEEPGAAPDGSGAAPVQVWPTAGRGDGQVSGLEPLPVSPPLVPAQPHGTAPEGGAAEGGASGPDGPHNQPTEPRPQDSPAAAPHGDTTRPRAASRRSLLLAGAAAGAAGLAVGGGAVAGWVTGRGGGLDALTRPGRTGAGADTLGGGRTPPPGTPPTALWRYDLPGSDSAKSRPLVWRGELGVLVGFHSSVAVDLRTGETVWSRNDLSSLYAPKVISSELVLVLDKSELVAFDARTGQRRWGDNAFKPGTPRFNGRSADELRAATGDGRTAFVTADQIGKPGEDTPEEPPHTLSAYDTRKRRERWHVELAEYETDDALSVQAAGASVVTMAPRDDVPQLTSYRLSDGEREWRRSLDGLKGHSTLSLSASSGTVYASRGGDLRAVRVDTGRELWSRRLVTRTESGLGRAVVRPGPPPTSGKSKGKKRDRRMYVADGHRTVFALAPEDGREIWRTELANDSLWRDVPELESSPSGKTVLAASSSGVVAIDARSGELLWRFRETRGDSADEYAVFPGNGVVLVTHTASAFALPVD
ncbi:PQQ-binding-like beta-propeller repeat protein [Streptomyces armeniacus]|uniref:outer membrane protein assembly factor BamB family protein n=1 Tax=Streptomyces armeniacus TaxID=83291 RepID=UPI001AD7F835|nr:PQQ-binding-like beta-propeller repeat protein [Streptomyces armeniacus]